MRDLGALPDRAQDQARAAAIQKELNEDRDDQRHPDQRVEQHELPQQRDAAVMCGHSARAMPVSGML